MELQDQLLAIERRLWTNDAAIYEHDLIDEALLAFAETGVITKSVAIHEIRRENQEGRRWEEVLFSDVQLLWLGLEAALLTYRVEARWAHEISTILALASSTYVRRDGVWKLAFHQQTRTDGPGAGEHRADTGARHLSRVAPARAVPARAVGALSSGAVAFGAFALGATAIGALAIGRLAVGAFDIKRGRVRSLKVDDLRIGRLHVATEHPPRVGP
jgi:hypothetical protein